MALVSIVRVPADFVKYMQSLLSEYLYKAPKYVASIAELRGFSRNIANGEQVQVQSYYGTSGGGGGGVFYYDASDTSTADDGGSCIVTASGKRFKRIFTSPKVFMEDFGVVPSTGTDSSAQVQAAMLYAEKLAETGFSKRVSLVCARKLKTSQTLFLNPAKVALESPGGSTEWVFDSAGTYVDNFAIHLTGNLAVAGQEGDTPYANTTIHAISHVMFVLLSGSSLATNVNFLKHYSTLAGASGRAEIVSQTGFFKVRTRGFKDVYTNGDNGWGLTFDQCGFDDFDRLAVLNLGVNNSERITFLECVAQNGRLGFDIYGWTGGLQFIGGSLDYIREGEVKNRGGYATFENTHIETDNRINPICISQFSTAAGITTFSKCTFVNIRNNLNTVNYFVADRRTNLVVEDCRFAFSEETVGGNIQTLNMRFTDAAGVDWRNNWVFSGQTGRHLMFSQGLLRGAKPAYATVKSSAGVTLTRANGELTVEPTAAASKNLQLLVRTPTGVHRFESWMTVFRECVLAGNCTLTVYRASDDGLIMEQVDQLTFGNGTGTLQPASDRADLWLGHGTYVFSYFLDNMSTGNKITIAAQGVLTWS